MSPGVDVDTEFAELAFNAGESLPDSHLYSSATRALWTRNADLGTVASLVPLWDFTNKAILSYKEHFGTHPVAVQVWATEGIARCLVATRAAPPNAKDTPLIFARWQAITSQRPPVSMTWLDVQASIEGLILAWQCLEGVPTP